MALELLTHVTYESYAVLGAQHDWHDTELGEASKECLAECVILGSSDVI